MPRTSCPSPQTVRAYRRGHPTNLGREKNPTKHVTYPKIQTQAVSQILRNADWKYVDTWKDHPWPEAPVKNKENAVLRALSNGRISIKGKRKKKNSNELKQKMKHNLDKNQTDFIGSSEGKH